MKLLNEYDLVVVGGGIVGAGVFRDAALHGLKTLMIDKKDFTSQTSQSSSKMLHGGIRYLETMDFELVAESLHEKNLWLKIAPHLCQEKSFYLPIYETSKRPMWMMKLGFFLYDFLSGFQNTPHRMLSKEQVLKDFPGLNPVGLKGAGVYYDAIVEDAKLTLEVIYDGLKEKNCHALNYWELKDLKPVGEKLWVALEDTLTGAREEVITKDLVFATGPFTDQLLMKWPWLKWSPQLLPSKGSHLWIKKEHLPLKYPMVMTPPDGRVIFVIPQRGSVLVGTTEVPNETSNYFDLTPSPKEINYLLENLNQSFPNLPNGAITQDQIQSCFAGIRPLVREGSTENLGKTARNHKTYWPRSNIGVVIGGKYTTFRVMAQDILMPIMKRHHLSYNPEATKRPLRQRSLVSPFKKMAITKELMTEVMKSELVRTSEDLWVRRLGIANKNHWQQPDDIAPYLEHGRTLF